MTLEVFIYFRQEPQRGSPYLWYRFRRVGWDQQLATKSPLRFDAARNTKSRVCDRGCANRDWMRPCGTAAVVFYVPDAQHRRY